jgi:hypothetical protein
MAAKGSMIILLSIVLLSLSVWSASAHRPVIVKDEASMQNPVLVEEPEISWAYYGRLEGEPHYFKIQATETFDLYVNILVPDFDPRGEPVAHHDMSFEIIKDERILYRAEGLEFQWKRFYEKYGRDHYYWGPEYDQKTEAGTYTIKVFNSGNSGKYSLAIGKIEKFTLPVLIGAMIKAQSLDRWFFKRDE